MTELIDIGPTEARALLDQDAVLVDVREPYELAIERIPGAVEAPLSALARGEPLALPEGKRAIFFCASGVRTVNNGEALSDLAGGGAYNLAGGIGAWRRAGLPTERG